MRRTGLRLMWLFASFAVVAVLLPVSSAFAAGKPSVSIWANSEGDETVRNLTDVVVSATINANGASTTYKMEYGPTPSYGYSTPEINIGSGTTGQKYEIDAPNLLSGKEVYYRVVATNSFGSASSKGQSKTAYWLKESVKTKFPAAYTSQGTLTIGIPTAGATVTCNESGSGAISGSVEPEKMYFHMSFSGCAVYYGGKFACTATVSHLYLGANLATAPGENSLVLTTPEGCFWDEVVFIHLTDFVARTSVEAFTMLAEYPLTFSDNSAFVGANPITINDSSVVHLSLGGNIGIANE